MDVSLLAHFGTIFLFLLVFVIIYSLLLSVKIFKGVEGSNGVYAVIALATAFFIAAFKPAAMMIMAMVPWFGALAIFIFLLMFIFRMFDSKDEDLFSNALKEKSVFWTILVISIIILVAGLSSSFGQNMLERQVGGTVDVSDNSQVVVDSIDTVEDEYIQSNNNDYNNANINYKSGTQGATATGDFGTNLLMTIVHPKVMGFLLIMIIGVLTIMMMAGSQETLM